MLILGISVTLFFQCMSALLNPINNTRKGIRWSLVAYTVAMFSFATIYVTTDLDFQSLCYIDNRAFPGGGALGFRPGPLGYQLFSYSKAINFVPNLVFILNTWLADALLASHTRKTQSPSSHVTTPPVVPLLRHLYDELLGHCHRLPNVSRFFGYVPTSPADQQ